MSQHFIVVAERDLAEQIAAELAEEFEQVRVVREAMAGEDDAEAVEWGVEVTEPNVIDTSRPVEQGLRVRFTALAEGHDGWYEARGVDADG